MTAMGVNVDYKFKLTPQTQTLRFPNVGNDLNNRLELRTGDSRPEFLTSCNTDSCDSWVDPSAEATPSTARP